MLLVNWVNNYHNLEQASNARQLWFRIVTEGRDRGCWGVVGGGEQCDTVLNHAFLCATIVIIRT